VWKITNKSNPESKPYRNLCKSESSWRTVRELLADNPRAPGGQSARALKTVYTRELLADSPPGPTTKNSITASFCEALFIPPTHPNMKYICLTCETESQAHSKHSKTPQSEILASPLQIFGLGLGLSKIQARFKFFPRDSPLLGISWLSPSLSISITLGAWLLDC
jgi:hypothetical protein